jgi:hypothetical protein
VAEKSAARRSFFAHFRARGIVAKDFEIKSVAWTLHARRLGKENYTRIKRETISDFSRRD